MRITLELPPDLEARLRAAAEAQHLPVEELVKALLYDFQPLLAGRAQYLKKSIEDLKRPQI